MRKEIDRKFLTWPFRTEDGRRYKLEVRYKQTNEDAECPITFYVRHTNPDFTEEDGNLETLRQKVTQRLAAMNELHWQPMLLVAVGEVGYVSLPGGAQHGLEVVLKEGLTFLVLSYEQGVAADGSSFWRCQKEGKSGSAINWRISRGQPWAKKADEALAQVAHHTGITGLPDTPELRSRLRALHDALVRLRVQLATLFNGEDVLERLLVTQTPLGLLTPAEQNSKPPRPK